MGKSTQRTDFSPKSQFFQLEADLMKKLYLFSIICRCGSFCATSHAWTLCNIKEQISDHSCSNSLKSMSKLSVQLIIIDENTVCDKISNKILFHMRSPWIKCTEPRRWIPSHDGGVS